MPKRKPMHAVRQTPARGNWIWLPSGAAAAVGLTLALLSYGNGGHAQNTAAPAGAGPAAASSPQPGSSHHTAGGGAAKGHGSGPAGTGKSSGTGASGGAAGHGSTAGKGTGSGSKHTSPGSGQSGPGLPSGNTAATRTVHGDAVFYDPGSAVGSCLLGPFQASGTYVSLPVKRFANGAACGTYLEVRGPRGHVQAEVVDLCPSCTRREINLSQTAFTKIAGTSVDSAPVSYGRVTNPRLPGQIQLRPELSAGALTALQVINNGNVLTSVAVAAQRRTGAPDWHSLTLGGHDFWVAGTPLSARRWEVRITDDQGHQVLLTRVRLVAGGTFRTQVWMYRAGTPLRAGP